MDHKTVYHGPLTKIGNVVLPYYDKDAASERRIEISIGLDCFPVETIVEVGAVIPAHEPVNHDVVDLYDSYEKSIRKDAITYDYTGKNVLSISTLEHIGRNDYTDLGDTQELNPAGGMICLENIIKESNKYMITFPLGWNKDFESRVKESNYQRIIMARDERNQWVYRCSKDDFDFEYGRPVGNGEFSYGNAICILTNIEDYLFDYDRIESVLK